MFAAVGDLFPFWEFLDIFLEAVSTDDEVMESLMYLQGDMFGSLVYKVNIMDDWRHVR